MASQAYYSGDWYECVANAAAGESPGTHPSKWNLIQIPDFLAKPVVEIAVASLLRGDGQNDKFAAQAKAGQAALYETFQRHRPRGDYKPLRVQVARD